MNIEIYKPELVQRLNDHIQAGRFPDAVTLIEKALDALDEKTPVAIPVATAPRRHISEVIEEITNEVPLEVFESLPRDGASEHDHYLYGAPKKDQ